MMGGAQAAFNFLHCFNDDRVVSLAMTDFGSSLALSKGCGLVLSSSDGLFTLSSRIG